MREYNLQCLDSHGTPCPLSELPTEDVNNAKNDVQQKFPFYLGKAINNWGAHWLVKHSVSNWRRGMLQRSAKGDDPEHDSFGEEEVANNMIQTRNPFDI